MGGLLVTDEARMVALGGTGAEPVLAQPPDQQIEPILPEERLAVVDQGRDAPVTRGLERALVGRDGGVELRGVRGRLRLERGELEPGARDGLGEVGALVPA